MSNKKTSRIPEPGHHNCPKGYKPLHAEEPDFKNLTVTMPLLYKTEPTRHISVGGHLTVEGVETKVENCSIDQLLALTQLRGAFESLQNAVFNELELRGVKITQNGVFIKDNSKYEA